MSPGTSPLLDRIVTYVIDPTVKVIFTLGLFLFFYGLVEYLWELKDGKADGDGRQHMLYGMIGMLIMVSVYGIIALIMNTLGIDFGTATDVSRIQNVSGNPSFFGQ